MSTEEISESREKFVSYWDTRMHDAVADGAEDKSVGYMDTQIRFDRLAAEMWDVEIAPRIPVEPVSDRAEPVKPRLLRGSEVTEAGLYRYRRDGKTWQFVLVAATPDGAPILLFTGVSPMVGKWAHLDTAPGEFCGPVSAVPPVYVAAKEEPATPPAEVPR